MNDSREKAEKIQDKPGVFFRARKQGGALKKKKKRWGHVKRLKESI